MLDQSPLALRSRLASWRFRRTDCALRNQSFLNLLSFWSHFSQVQISQVHCLPGSPSRLDCSANLIPRSPQYGQASGGCFVSFSSSAVRRDSKVAMRRPTDKARLPQSKAFFTIETSEPVVMPDSSFDFTQSNAGLTRFPPNVEQITVEHESVRTWLVVRRNDVTLRFPLSESDCRHLATLLMGEK